MNPAQARHNARVALMRLMHQTYCREVSRFHPYTVREELRWDHLLGAVEHYGVTGDEAVRLVARRLLKLNTEGKKRGFDGWQHKLQFSRFVEDGFFTEHLSAAIAEARKPAVPANVVAMQTLTGRKHEAPGVEARKASEVINSEGFKKLMKFRDEL